MKNLMLWSVCVALSFSKMPGQPCVDFIHEQLTGDFDFWQVVENPSGNYVFLGRASCADGDFWEEATPQGALTGRRFFSPHPIDRIVPLPDGYLLAGDYSSSHTYSYGTFELAKISLARTNLDGQLLWDTLPLFFSGEWSAPFEPKLAGLMVLPNTNECLLATTEKIFKYTLDGELVQVTEVSSLNLGGELSHIQLDSASGFSAFLSTISNGIPQSIWVSLNADFEVLNCKRWPLGNSPTVWPQTNGSFLLLSQQNQLGDNNFYQLSHISSGGDLVFTQTTPFVPSVNKPLACGIVGDKIWLSSMGANYTHGVSILSTTGHPIGHVDLGKTGPAPGFISNIQTMPDGQIVLSGHTHLLGDAGNPNFMFFNCLPPLSTEPVKSDFGQIKVFPNPTSGRIDVQMDASVGSFSYTILDNTGTVVKAGKGMNSTFLQFDDLPSGTYFLNIVTEGSRSFSSTVVLR